MSNIPNWYLENVLNYLNQKYADKVHGDIVTSVMGIFRTYDREIAVLWEIGYSSIQIGEFLKRYLNFKPEISERYIATVPNNMSGWEKIIKMKNDGLKLRLRGRGTNRKARVATIGRTLNSSHDLPISLSDRIAIYRR